MKRTIIIAVTFILLQLIMGVAILALLSAVTGISNPASLQKSPAYVWTFGALLLLVNVFMCVFVYFLMKRPGENLFAGYLGLSGAPTAGAAVVAMFAMMFFVSGITELFHFSDLLADQMDNLNHNPLCVLTICLVGPIAEEVVFRRGVMGSLLASRRYHRYALVISAAIFAVIHFNPAQIPGAFMAGLFLGWLYLRTHSLVLPSLCHVLNNTSSVVAYIAAGAQTDTGIMDSFPSPALFAVAMVLSVVVFTVAAYGVKRTTYRQSFPIEDSGPQSGVR